MIVFVQVLVWSFFIVIFSKLLHILAFKFQLPVHPTIAYAAIACVMIGSVYAFGNFRALRKDLVFFGAFGALVALAALMYRGQSPGPDFGGKLLSPYHIPSAFGYVIWPILNFITGVSLYVLTQREEIRRTISTAAFWTFVVFVGTMWADMWWPAVFGDPNGRAAGLAQNANDAALIVVLLAILTFPVTITQPPHARAFYVVAVAAAAVLFSQSRAGIALVILCAAVLVYCGRSKLLSRFNVRFAAGYLFAVVVTIIFAPALHGPNNYAPETQVEVTAAGGTVHTNPTAILDKPVDLKTRLETRASFDEAASDRLRSLSFFTGIIKSHPMGLGTGFTNKFIAGPHNTWLKLAADLGILACVLLASMLAAVAWTAFKLRSPMLAMLTITAAVWSVVSHTVIVDPALLVVIPIALGLTENSESPLSVHFSEDS